MFLIDHFIGIGQYTRIKHVWSPDCFFKMEKAAIGLSQISKVKVIASTVYIKIKYDYNTWPGIDIRIKTDNGNNSSELYCCT